MSTQADKGVGSDADPTPEPGFEIDGERFLVPTMDTLTLSEERILYLYADCVIKDFIPPHPSASEQERGLFDAYQRQKIRNPNFKMALAYIAYKRRHPDAGNDLVLKALEGVNAFELDLAVIRGDDDDPPAPSSQNEPRQQNATNEPTSFTHSGSNGNGTSDGADVIPLSIGTTELVTSSPGVPPTGLAS